MSLEYSRTQARTQKYNYAILGIDRSECQAARLTGCGFVLSPFVLGFLRQIPP